ncbi:DUF3078 domain-containing protein [Prevotella sp. E9-3]|uniref:DUF3078 domain-containing protein n=1 Tax=Prevotella sp. E9-3 TaxID=2913621 RepID=UPI001EDA1EE4|nr:DUF3078 domain-containing protein [Prevotella sp. E9-3]UKK49531.1 DUF3078 domain-containing protein [Prevotella sp. E9-3]
MRKVVLFIAAVMTIGVATAQDRTNQYGQYYPLFGPLTFYHSVAQNRLSLTRAESEEELRDEISASMLRIYLNRPDLVQNAESDMKESGQLRNDLESPIQQQVSIVEEMEPMPEMLPEADPVEVAVEKPVFWKFRGDGNVQLMQNYVSDNWYKGGESNHAAVGSLTLEANYDNKSKWKWENKLEMKLGFQTSPSDTVNKFKTNEDLLRYTGKIGLQAFKRWYYTLQVLSYTQFTRGLKANDERTYSDFMSPFNLNVGIGMDYKVDFFKGKMSGTVNMSPLAVNYRYVDRADLARSFGVKVDEGHTHSLTDFGSQLTASIEWKMNDVVTWKTRLYYFSSFHRAEMEWENTFTLRVSKYITANVFLFPRFDDSNQQDEKLGFWQFKEYSSLGFSYNF